MTELVVTAVRPEDVAREVEACVQQGPVDHIVVRAIAHGGMLDRERLGAARYAAGLHARVELEEPVAAQRR